jgi:hypothetical protein
VVSDQQEDDADDLTDAAHELLERFETGGEKTDLAAAIDLYERALAALLPDENPWRFGKMALLERAGVVLRAAEDTCPADERAVVLDNLALTLRDTAIATDDIEPLREGVQLHRRAVTLLAAEDPERPRYLDNLGGAHWELYAVTGDVAALVAAEACFRDAVQGTDQFSPDLSLRRTNLAMARHGVYRVTGDATKLVGAIATARLAVRDSTSTSTHVDRPRQLARLAGMLVDWHERASRRRVPVRSLEDLGCHDADHAHCLHRSTPRGAAAQPP